MNIVVYSCVTHSYDRCLMPARHEPGISFVCFSDQPRKITASGWDLRPITSPPSLTRGHDINRYHKFFAHHLFPSARWSIYLDGNVSFEGEFSSLISRVQERGANIGTFSHPHGHSLRKEAEVCALSKFDTWDFAKVEEQLEASAAAGIDINDPIPACYILVRDHTSPRLSNAMSLWWSQIFEYTKRDQMSFPWVLKTTALKFQPLDGEGGIDPALVQRADHSQKPLWKRAMHKTRRASAENG